jgi:hypothetical protein
LSQSAELQRYVVEALRASADVAAIAGARVQAGQAPAAWELPYVTVRVVDAIEADEECIPGENVAVEVHAWSREETECLRLSDATKAALHRTSADLGTWALVDLWFVNGTNVGDPDGITEHRVARFEALVERAA